MAKITQEQRLIYQNKIKYYKNKIDAIKKDINNIKIEISKNKSKSSILNYKIANMILNTITNFCSMNEISVFLLEVKNTAFLEKARQQLYEVIILVENIVSNFLDVPFNDYAEKLIPLSEINDLQRLNFIKKIGYCIELVKENLGENTKWKWSFVEIEGRFSIISKNFFDLKRFQRLEDPRQEGYPERKKYFSIIQKLLLEASNGYREKFELSTKDVEDLKKAIDFQKALLRLNQLTGDQDKIEKNKKTVEVWTSLLEKHLAETEEELKKKKFPTSSK
jgi:hypothetical protein